MDSKYVILEKKLGQTILKMNPNVIKLKNMFQKKSKVGFCPFYLRTEPNFPEFAAKLASEALVESTEDEGKSTAPGILIEDVLRGIDDDLVQYLTKTSFSGENYNNLVTRKMTSILGGQIRSSLLVSSESGSSCYSHLDRILVDSLSLDPTLRVCVFDFNLFRPSLPSLLEKSRSSANLLFVSFRESAPLLVEKGIFEVGFRDLEPGLIVSDSQIIYFYERVLKEIVGQFDPSLVFILSRNSFSRDSISSRMNLTGDCKNPI